MEEKKEEKKKKGKKRVMSILGGKFLVREDFSKQFPFLLYVTLLLMVIITNTFIAENRTRKLAETSKQLNDLQVEYVQLKSDILEASKQSVLVKKLQGTGIKEATTPLRRIEIEQPKTKEEEP